MKNVRWFSDKQLYQLCIGCTSLQLSLFRQIQTHTDRYSSSVIFFYFPVICSRWEHNLLCVLTACVQHALIFFAIKSDRNPKHLFLLLLSLLCKLYFCRGAKDSGKDAEQRNARTGQCSLLAYFGCFYFMFLAMGISTVLLRQTGSRIPGSLTSFWQWLLMLWPASQDAVCERVMQQGKEEFK